MLRLILLTVSCGVIACGFFMMFAIGGALGIVLALGLIVSGSFLLWRVEVKTKKSLEEDSLLNRILNTDA